LYTAARQTFSIDEPPHEFTLPMFYAMRDRIIQLEDHIARMSASAMAGNSSDDEYGGHHKRYSEGYPASATSTKRLHVREATVRSHLDAIAAQLRSALARRPAPFPDPAHATDVLLHENMTVDEFVAVFDEKGGCVSAVPKDPANPNADALVAVEFNTQESLSRLLGDEVTRGLTAPVASMPGKPVQCYIRTLNVLYDKASAQVSMSFQLSPTLKL
jgi:hypothetical protein